MIPLVRDYLRGCCRSLLPSIVKVMLESSTINSYLVRPVGSRPGSTGTHNDVTVPYFFYFYLCFDCINTCSGSICGNIIIYTIEVDGGRMTGVRLLCK